MALTLTDARTKIKLRLKAHMYAGKEAFTDNEIDSAVAESVLEFSKNRPVKAIEDIQITADQSEYDWPSGCIYVEPMLYANSEIYDPDFFGVKLTPETYWTFFTEQLAQIAESPALLTRQRIYAAHQVTSSIGSIIIDENRRKIILSPTPTENATGKIMTEKAHSINQAGDGYDTIQDSDVPAVIDYAQAFLMRILANAYLINDQKVGDRDVRGAKIADGFNKAADRLEARFRSRTARAIASRD